MDTQAPTLTTPPKAMGVERSGSGEGFTKEEALQDWLDTDPVFETTGGLAVGDTEAQRWGRLAIDSEKEIEFKCTREPYRPKRCKTKITKQTGSRLWSTRHVVYNSVTGEALGSGATKAEAIKLGRELALEHDVECTVQVEKDLTKGEAIEARITPKTKRKGRWKFRASFLY